MGFREIVMNQKLTPTEEAYAAHITKNWERYSTAVSLMTKSDTLKILKYLIEKRPTSNTLGQRAVTRFNQLNKARWEDLTNGG